MSFPLEGREQWWRSSSLYHGTHPKVQTHITCGSNNKIMVIQVASLSCFHMVFHDRTVSVIQLSLLLH